MAAITFRCSSCQQMLKVSADKAGKKVRCGKCGTILPIPAGDAADQVKAAPKSPPPVSDDDFDDEAEPVRRRKYADDDDEPQRRRRPPERDDEDVEDRPRRRSRPVDEDLDDDDRRGRRGRYDEEEDDGPRRRRRAAPPSGVVTGIGLLNLLLAAVIIVAAIGLMIAGPTFIYRLAGMAENVMAQQPFQPNDPNAQLAIKQGKEAVREVAGIASFIFVLIGSCSIVLGGVPLILAGIGVLKRQQWGRVLTLILGGLSLLIAIGIVYKFWPFNWFGWTWTLVHVGYTVAGFVFLLMPRFAEEFA